MKNSPTDVVSTDAEMKSEPVNYSAVDALMEIFGFYRVNRQLTPEQSGKLVAYNTAMHDGNEVEIQRTRAELIESISDVVTGDNRVK